MTVERGDLDRTLISGLSWNAGGRWVGQLIAWGSTLIVVRLLTPADYGIVAMGGTLFSLITTLSDGGIRSAIVNRAERHPATLHQLHSVCVLIGMAGTAVAALSAIPISQFFSEPRLVPVILVVSLTYTVLGFRMVPLATLQRDLSFRVIAANDLLMVGAAAVTSVAIAVAGGGYWALILSHVIGTTVASVAAWRAAPHRLVRPVWSEVRGAVGFGGHLMLSQAAEWLRGNIDLMLIGRFLGKGLLGSYRVAMDFASLPLEKVAGVLLQVTGPVFASVKDQRGALARYLLGLSEILALVSWPLAVGLALVADLAVPLVLGTQWTLAVLPLQIFAVAAMVRCVSPLLSTLVLARGNAAFLARVSVIGTVCTGVAMTVAVRWGIGGVAAVWALSFPCFAAPVLIKALQETGLAARDFFARLAPTSLACAMEVLAVAVLRSTWTPDGDRLTLLAACVAIGGFAYLLTLWLVAGKRLGQLASLVRERAWKTRGLRS